MRRRKQKFTWLPVLGSRFGEGEAFYGTSTFFEELVPPLLDINPPTMDNAGLFCIPVVPDFSQQPDILDLTASLRDRVEGQDWLLKRLVGKLHVSTRDEDTTDTWPAVLVTCGFFVARSYDADPAACDLQDEEIDPRATDNVQDPWIWRRTWKLGVTSSNDWGYAGGWPKNNAAYGSVADGPHIDSKVARRITREHRLWFAGSAFGVSPRGLISDDECHIDLSLDLRVLGAMRRGKNVSSF